MSLSCYLCKNIHLCVTLGLRLLSCMHRDKVKELSLTKENRFIDVSMPTLCAMTNKRQEYLIAIETSGGDSGGDSGGGDGGAGAGVVVMVW